MEFIFSFRTIAAKVSLISVLVLVIMGGVIGVVFVTFDRIELSMSNIARTDVPRIVNNAHIGRDLSLIFAETSQLIAGFLEQKKLLTSEGKRLIKDVRTLSRDQQETEFQQVLQHFGNNLQQTLDFAADVGNIYIIVTSAADDLDTALQHFETTLDAAIVRALSNNLSTAGLKRQKLDLPWFRETLLRIRTHLRQSTQNALYLLTPKSEAINNFNEIFLFLQAIGIKFGYLHSADIDIVREIDTLKQRLALYKNKASELQDRLRIFQGQAETMRASQREALTVMASKDQDVTRKTEELHQQMTMITHSSRRMLIGFTVLLVVVLAVAAILTKRRLLAPLHILAQAAGQFAQGDWNYRLNIAQQDELGQLAKAFTSMAQQLEQSFHSLEKNNAELRTTQHELRQHRDNLEELIEKRTQQLSKAMGDLTLAKEKAEITNKAKSTFLANMSHELRSPLTAIIGYASLLAIQKDLPEKALKKVQVIDSSGKHLVQMINDILEVSKIEAGQLELKPEIFSPEQLFNDVRDMFMLQAQQKGLELYLEHIDILPKQLETDIGKLRQILINLIGNACKFTDCGSIIVSTGYRLLKDNRVQVEIRIKDTGPGMSPEEINRLFRPFEQGDSGRKKGGTGLGLVISRKYAELLGGELTLSSRLGEGSCFTLTCLANIVPLQTKEDPAFNNCPAYDYGPLAGREFLVADDDPTLRSFFSSLLSTYGIRVIEADNGSKAVALAFKEQPDMIIMDIRMPEQNGHEAIHHLKSSEIAHIPILIATASILGDDLQKLEDSKADYFVGKPVDVDVFFEKIADALHLPKINPCS